MIDVEPILDALARTSRVFERGFAGHLDDGASENPSGDVQNAADVWMDDVLFEAMTDLDVVGTYASEERDEAVDVDDGLAVATDPLDGSSNLAVNTTVGTIVGVYDAPLPAAGRDLVAGAYLLYGPMTTMTVAVEEADGGPVERRRIEDGDVVDSTTVTLPDDGDVCGVSGRTDEWSRALASFVNDRRRDHKLRYTGTMVADVEHVIDRGGLAGYPSLASSPDGILRLEYESNPVAFIVERAGGRSSTGDGSILDVEPDSLHQRVPSYFGSPSLIAALEETLPKPV